MSRETRDWLGRAAAPVRERWRDRPEGSSTPALEARAGALFSEAVQREPLAGQRLEAIGARLRRRPRRAAAPRKLIVRLAAGLSLLIVGGALAATATRYFDLPLPFGRPSHPPSQPQSPARRSHVGKVNEVGKAGQVSGQVRELGRASSGAEPTVPPPSPPVQRRASAMRAGEGHAARPSASALEAHQVPWRPTTSSSPPALSPPPPADPSPPPRPTLQPPEPPGPSQPPPSALVSSAPRRPSPTPLAEESALIMSALTALRRDEDATRALAILDRHDLRFPRGDLADEAALARVEALVKVKRSDEALALLEARGPARRGDSQRKLSLTRAELRAAAGRCRAALDELDALLGGAPPADAVTERALWGRAACRASGGQFDSARVDLETYLRLFPAGQFARGARAALEGTGSGPSRSGR